MTSSVTWPHTGKGWFPVAGRLTPTLYLAWFPIYYASNIWGSRPWLFGVTWSHRSREHWTHNIWFPFPMAVYYNQPSISHRYWDITSHLSTFPLKIKCTGQYNFWEIWTKHSYAIFPVTCRQRLPRGVVSGINPTIDQRASILQCLDRPIENALGVVKLGENWV